MFRRKLKSVAVVASCFGAAFAALGVVVRLAEWVIEHPTLRRPFSVQEILAPLPLTFVIGAFMGSVVAGLIVVSKAADTTRIRLKSIGFVGGGAVFLALNLGANGLSTFLNTPTIAQLVGVSLCGAIGAGVASLIGWMARRNGAPGSFSIRNSLGSAVPSGSLGNPDSRIGLPSVHDQQSRVTVSPPDRV